MFNSTTTIKKIRLGDDITTYCGKCKEERIHTVISLNTPGAVDRVQCGTCHSPHLYRVKQHKPIASRTAESRGRSSVEATNASPARNYSTTECFRVGDRISHSKFGSGTVTDVRPGKINVRFSTDERILIHAC